MITMARIQGSSMGYPGFQKPIVQNPGLRGIFDIVNPIEPMFPPLDFPLDAGSPSGDGGADAPAPAPSPGAEVPATDFPVFQPQPTFLFPVQEPIVPVAPVAPVAAALPTWAVVGGSVLAGLAIGALLLRKG